MTLWLYCRKMQLFRNPGFYLCGLIDNKHEICVPDGNERTIPVNFNTRVCQWCVRRALSEEEIDRLNTEGIIRYREAGL